MLRSVWKCAARRAAERELAGARVFLEQFGIDGFALNFPHELSVGMRQRAALARAFLTDPQILLMDEPFSALDAQSKLILQEELLRIWKDHRKTVIYVTHDIDEAVPVGGPRVGDERSPRTHSRRNYDSPGTPARFAGA